MEDDLPVNYKVIDHSMWEISTGRIAGSAQPGYYYISDVSDKDILLGLKKDQSIKASIADSWITSELQELDNIDVNVIYSLATSSYDRDPEILKWIWQNIYNREFITEIDGVKIGVEDFHASTFEQLDKISDDAIIRLKQDKNILVTCGAGVGRTGTALAAIYMKVNNKYDAEDAITYIRSNYKGAAIEGVAQKNALIDFALNSKQQFIEKANTANASREDIDKALRYSIELNKDDAIKFFDTESSIKNIVSYSDSKEYKNQVLLFLLKYNKLNDAMHLIELGANINCQLNGKSLLNLAIENNNMLLIENILEHPDIDLNLVNLNDITLNSMLIKYLILHGIKLSKFLRDSISNNLIDECWDESIKQENNIIINNLLDYDSNLKQRKENSANFAYNNQYWNAYIGLILLGFNDQEKNIHIVDAFNKILERKSIDDLILQGLDLTLLWNELDILKHINIEEILIEAIKNSKLGIIINLLKIDDNIIKIKIRNTEIIDYAIKKDQIDLAIALAEMGFDTIHYKSNSQQKIDNALCIAISFKDIIKTQELLENGANPNIIFGTDKTSTPLLEAIKFKNQVLVNILIKNKADVNYANKEGISPLIQATISRYEHVQKLIDNAANVDATNPYTNKSILMYAINEGDQGLIRILIQNKVQLNEMVADSFALMEAVILKKLSIVKLLVASGASIDQVNSRGQSALIKAVLDPSKISNKIIKALMDNGANPNIADKNGDTAISIAKDLNRDDRLKLML
ncbi:MAG: ankyrin repeat domain-containing protein [Rickettsiales bacterium]